MKRRNTPSKEAILELLTNSKKAMSHEAIEQKIDLAIDRATIYRVLNRFCEDGLVHRVVAEDGKQYFAVCIKNNENSLMNNHFHFRCIECQTIECLPIPVFFSLDPGYHVQSVNCVLTGTCKDCSSKTIS